MNHPTTEKDTLPAQYTRLMRRTPMLRVAAGLATGILLAEYLPDLPSARLWIVLATGLTLLFVGVFLRRRWPAILFLLGLWAALVGCGGLLVRLHAPSDPFGEGDKSPGQTFLQLRLTDTPRPTAHGYKVPATVEARLCREGWQTAQGEIMLFMPADSMATTLRYGSRLMARGTPQRPSAEENPGQFDYREYLRRKGILWQCYLPEGCWKPLPQEAHSPVNVTAWGKQLQLELVQRIRHCNLTPSQQGIAEAMLLGWRDDLDPQTFQQFRDAGITHLLCVSGLHVGIVALLVRGLLFFLGRRRWQRLVKGAAQLAAVWLFVAVTGMSPSALRAGVMFSLLIIGDMIARQTPSANNLATSAVLLLCFRPMLLFDVGFQLSYAAVAGIIIGYKPMCQLIIIRYRKIGWRLVRGIWRLTCLSTVAQLATLPLTLYYFHQFPLYFLIANILIVPFAGLLLGTLLTLVLSYGWPWLCDVVAGLLRWELSLVDGLIRWVSGLPYATIDHVYCDLPMALLLACAILLALLWLCLRKRWLLPATLACLVLVMAWLRMTDYRTGKQEAVIAYAAGKHWAVEYLCGHESYLVADSAVAAQPALIDYQRAGLLTQRRILHTTVLTADTCYADTRCAVYNHGIRFGQRLIYVVDRTNSRPFRPYAPLPGSGDRQRVDLLLVSPDTWADTEHLGSWFQYDTLLHRPQKAWTCGLE